MKKTVVLDVVGLTPGLLGPDMPFLTRWAAAGKQVPMGGVLPAVTCTAQATYLTGVMPSQHGIVANGWYFRDECEVKFWRQSNKLVQAPKIWDRAREIDPTFTVANIFWWYNMYSSVDVAVTPRPMYPSDGRKLPDIYTQPADLRPRLQERFGQFPLFHYWGPATSISVSQWIAKASMAVDEEYNPTLTLIYIPHLDYNFQRIGPGDPLIAKDLREVDLICEELITFYERRGAQAIVLSEYGITPVSRAVSLNRVLREHGTIAVREELGRELLDAGASIAFAVADHQVAHIYVNDPSRIEEVRALIETVPGVGEVLGEAGKRSVGLDHPRSGELVAVAEPDAWFTYYYWLDDAKAPDFAPTVDIHRKPGYDPAELFIDPALKFPTLKAGFRVAQKKLGFRYLMDVVPLYGDLVRGSHGRLPSVDKDGPIFITRQAGLVPGDRLAPADVHDVILAHLTGNGRGV
ncbi:MAG TPA: nucleotide pyrophosphatase/phosphodiesterase family protein [Rhodothermales bacterium]|nr:nucleotide pyrophosphatase/phosphodiesterase family protein [Rhodothermales bacterium]